MKLLYHRKHLPEREFWTKGFAKEMLTKAEKAVLAQRGITVAGRGTIL